MTTYTDGQICYGVLLEEGVELPWESDEHDGDIERWWRYDVLGYENPFEMFTPEGAWIGGEPWPEEKTEQYYGERKDFDRANPPLPVELVNYCSGNFPMLVLAIPASRYTASRGYPEKFEPSKLLVDEGEVKRLLDFCKEYNIKFAEEPAWYLSSYWG